MVGDKATGRGWRARTGNTWRARCATALPIALVAFTLAALLAGCASSSVAHTATPTATSHMLVCPAAPATANAQAQLDHVVCEALLPLAGHIARVVTTYDAQKQSALVVVTFSDTLPQTKAQIAAAHERVKSVCFLAQRALWTTPPAGVALSGATVNTQGVTLDDYADSVIGGYGEAMLTAATSAHFAWPTLTPDSAWSHYDQAMLTPDYGHIYGEP